MYLFSVFTGVGAHMLLAHIWRPEDDSETLGCMAPRLLCRSSYIDILVAIMKSHLSH